MRDEGLEPTPIPSRRIFFAKLQSACNAPTKLWKYYYNLFVIVLQGLCNRITEYN